MDLNALRKEYSRATLDESAVDADPFAQFVRWFNDARAGEVPEPNAMTLATVNTEGQPSARIVLLKGIYDDGFLFFTDYRSRKGQELDANPAAALVFWWHELERQVRVAGRCERHHNVPADRYFATRPHGSQIGAWASTQSSVLPSREVLEEKVREAERRFGGGPVPRPEHWGGYRLVAHEIEFWQGRPSRLHDRIVYTRTPEHGWRIARLSP
jgi:pyridoxamine 5'-phosphate oxidase